MNNIENEGEIKFNILLNQIEKCLQADLYYVAIMTSLVIPDIGGAVDSANGKTDQKKYVNWFDKYAKRAYMGKVGLSGGQCYYLRCSMLHQGITEHKKIKARFVSFESLNIPPNFISIDTNKEVMIEPKNFCNSMIYAAYNWLEDVHNSDLFKKNMNSFMSLYSFRVTEG